MKAFNVWLGNKMIDTVFFDAGGKTIAEKIDYVKRSLINHDGYNPGIKVTWPKGQRVTADYWELQGHYEHGWECLTAETSAQEIRQRKKEYRENEPGTQLRIVKKREHI